MSEASDYTAWRLVKTRRAATAFDGEGAFRFGGRWNSRGKRMVYASESLSLALLEVLVHLDASSTVPEMSAIALRIPRELLSVLPRPSTEPKEADFPGSLRESRARGDRWLSEAANPAISVPSVIVPSERNILVNPLHPKFHKLEIFPPEPLKLDERLLHRFGGG